MIEFSLEGKKRKNLILFVHGLTGNNMTWVNQSGVSFSDLLSSNKEIKQKFDIAYFNYYSRLITSTAGKVMGGFVSKIISGFSNSVKLNLDVKNISDLLYTELDVQCDKYDNIIIIAHSLGGLVAKSVILDIIKKGKPLKIKQFISLAVPHDGANLALIGKALSGNIQLENLTPLGETVKRLNNEWILANADKLPKTLYCQGKYDLIVPNTSSVGYQSTEQDVLYFEEDHSSIAKPSSKKSTLFLAVQQNVNELLNNQEITEILTIRDLADKDQFNDEDFVLKLMIADVHHKNISSAKHSFYNAEFIRKVVVAKKIVSLDEFQNLYKLIEGLYNVAFGLLTAGKLKNGNELVAHIHEKIQNEDQKILKSIASLSFVHKTGMLHQLANDQNGEVWWADGHSNDTILEYKQTKTEE
jgi:hypothetical protein